MTDPLLDRKILVTRPDDAGEALARALAGRGARPLFAPALRMSIDPDLPIIAEARRAVQSADRLLLTSRYALVALMARHTKVDGKFSVWAVGKTTADFARKNGFSVTQETSTGGISALTDAIMADPKEKNLSVVWPCGDLADEEALDRLKERRIRVDRFVVYKTLDAYAGGGLPDELTLFEMEAVVFASPSAVKNFTAAVEEDLFLVLRDRWKTVVIGATTEAAAAAAGWLHITVAPVASNEGLVRGLEAAFLNA